ncbi:MAG: dihydrodipicolinate synthase family protein [Actinobacteria bacterium]|nr:dihydrodipicolinate synthase family protein [Actinomycetota bacterium]
MLEDRPPQTQQGNDDGRKTLVAAIVTPLRKGGEEIDEEAFGPLVEHVEAGDHCDGLFITGTAGEGILLGQDERRRVAELYCSLSKGRRIVQVGSQTTTATVSLAAHAAEIGADAVAVIPPPYYRPSDEAVVAHLVAAGKACAPTPFFIYAFAARSGYKLNVDVVEAVGEQLDNLAGMKVSEPDFDDVLPFLGLGLEILVGPDGLIPQALAAGAAGSASAVANVFPERIREVLDAPTAAGGEALEALRREIAGRDELSAALKLALARKGVPIRPDVRAPLLPAR